MNKIFVEFPKLGIELSVTREAFTIGDFAIYWYAVFIAVGAILAVIYGIKQAKEYGIDSDKLIDLAIVALLFGIIGARAYYVIFNLDSYSSFAQMINIRDGGLAIYGGLIFGILSAFIASRFNKCRFLPALDIAAGGFFIGQALGRWGNFTNQEAFGFNTDSIFGMYSLSTKEYLTENGWELFKQGIEVDPSAPVHPCFLYESIWCIIGFILILFYRKIRKFDGESFLFYCAFYGLGRFFIEGLRTDSLYIGNFRVSQLVSLLICVIAVVLIITLRLIINKKRKTNPEFLMLYVDTKESKMQFMESDELVIEKAGELLSEASEKLNEAEDRLSKLSGVSEKKTDEFEEMAEEFLSDDERLDIIDKLINISLLKASKASELLERFLDDEESANEAENTIDEEVIQEFDDSLDSKTQILREQIESTREYIDEYSEIIEKAKALKEENEEVPTEAEEEVIDSVADESDEIDIPSPNDNK